LHAAQKNAIASAEGEKAIEEWQEFGASIRRNV